MAGEPSAAAVSLAATLTPENKSRQTCEIEDTDCDYADETINVQVTPKSIPADWILVVDSPPSSSTLPNHFVKAVVKPLSFSGTTTTLPAVGLNRSVWVYQAPSDSKSVSYSLNYRNLAIVSRPANHLVIEMPDLFNEFDPSTACGPQVGYKTQPSTFSTVDLGNAFCPNSPTPLAPDVGDNPASYYAPEAATATEILKDPQQLKNFTLDSSDDATAVSDQSSSTVPDAYDWTGSYQLQPTVYASSIQAAGRVSLSQLVLGVALGALAAALFTAIEALISKT